MATERAIPPSKSSTSSSRAAAAAIAVIGLKAKKSKGQQQQQQKKAVAAKNSVRSAAATATKAKAAAAAITTMSHDDDNSLLLQLLPFERTARQEFRRVVTEALMSEEKLSAASLHPLRENDQEFCKILYHMIEADLFINNAECYIHPTLLQSTVAIGVMRFLNFLNHNYSLKLQAMKKKYSMVMVLEMAGIPHWVIECRNKISHDFLPCIEELFDSLSACFDFIRSTLEEDLDYHNPKSFEYLFYDSKADEIFNLLMRYSSLVKSENSAKSVDKEIAKEKMKLHNQILALIDVFQISDIAKAFCSDGILFNNNIDKESTSITEYNTCALKTFNLVIKAIMKKNTEFMTYLTYYTALKTEEDIAERVERQIEIAMWINCYTGKLHNISPNYEFNQIEKSLLWHTFQVLVKYPSEHLKETVTYYAKFLVKFKISDQFAIAPLMNSYGHFLKSGGCIKKNVDNDFFASINSMIDSQLTYKQTTQ